MAYYVSQASFDAQKQDLQGVEVILIGANLQPMNEKKPVAKSSTKYPRRRINKYK